MHIIMYFTNCKEVKWFEIINFILKNYLRKEGNVLFNDTLECIFIYGYMVLDMW